MFDVSWGEMLVIGVIALVVIGPKELPGVIRALGRGLGKLRSMAGEFRAQFDEAMREADMQDVAGTFADLRDTASGLSTATFDPIRNEIENAVQVARTAAPAPPAPVASPPLPAVQGPAPGAPLSPAAEPVPAGPVLAEPAAKPRRRSVRPKNDGGKAT